LPSQYLIEIEGLPLYECAERKKDCDWFGVEGGEEAWIDGNNSLINTSVG
jgi:hypothetical protein